MRVSMFVGGFPAVSETFILRQITGLIDLGHTVEIFAQERPADDEPVHVDVRAFDLLSRTTYIDIPSPSGYWELPVWPVTGKTWVPGADKPISNAGRIVRALPTLLGCAIRAPK